MQLFGKCHRAKYSVTLSDRKQEDGSDILVAAGIKMKSNTIKYSLHFSQIYFT
jgi:hypothetical protein